MVIIFWHNGKISLHKFLSARQSLSGYCKNWIIWPSLEWLKFYLAHKCWWKVETLNKYVIFLLKFQQSFLRNGQQNPGDIAVGTPCILLGKNWKYKMLTILRAYTISWYFITNYVKKCIYWFITIHFCFIALRFVLVFKQSNRRICKFSLSKRAFLFQ